MTYDGPTPHMSYRPGDQLQPGTSAETPVQYEVEHEEDNEHGVTWRVIHNTEA